MIIEVTNDLIAKNRQSFQFIRSLVDLPHEDVHKYYLSIVSGAKDLTVVASCEMSWGDHTPFLSHFHVHPEHRRKGFGTVLLIEAIGVARAWEKWALSLYVRPQNKAAIGLYRKLGFRVYLETEPNWLMAREVQ